MEIKKSYDEIIKSYNKDERLKYFDEYRNSKNKIFSVPVLAECYVIDEKNTDTNKGAKYKKITVNINKIKKVMFDGELLFQCTCNPDDFSISNHDENTGTNISKSVFHRLERMMINTK